MFPPTDVIGGFSHWHVDNDDAPPENVPTGAESQTNSFVLFFFFFIDTVVSVPVTPLEHFS